MFAFLRKIRLRLLSQATSEKARKSLIESGSARKPASPARRYILYAIGEVALVVIGILIALQVNNWNEQRKLKNEEVKILKEIRSALIKDHEDIIANFEEHESAATSCFILTNTFSENLPYHDSLKFHFSNVLNTTRFNHTSSAYETLKIKGTDLVKNDSLRVKLIEYYDNLVDYQFDLQRLSLQSFDQAKERQFELFKSMCVCKEGIEPINYEALKKNPYYSSWLKYTQQERRWEARNFLMLKVENEELVALINDMIET